MLAVNLLGLRFGLGLPGLPEVRHEHQRSEERTRPTVLSLFSATRRINQGAWGVLRRPGSLAATITRDSGTFLTFITYAAGQRR